MGFSKLLPTQICTHTQVLNIFHTSYYLYPRFLAPSRWLEYIIKHQNGIYKIDIGYRAFILTICKKLPRLLKSLLYFTKTTSRANLETFVIRLMGQGFIGVVHYLEKLTLFLTSCFMYLLLECDLNICHVIGLLKKWRRLEPSMMVESRLRNYNKMCVAYPSKWNVIDFLNSN